MNKDTFHKLKMVKEYPGWFLKRTKPLRVYRSSDTDKSGKVTYRYHFGFPVEFIKPFCPLIESTPFWGEQHWAEQDGFWLWWTPVTSDAKNPLPLDELNKELNRDLAFRRKAFMGCLDFYRKKMKEMCQ